MFRYSQSTATLLLLISSSVALADEKIDFNRDIRPILSENCILCHGPDPSERKGGRRNSGGLRLDTETGSQKDIDGYAALVPGDPEDSELFFLVTSDDEDERMPPPKHGDRLDEREIALLEQWIVEGGKYDRHWSYKKPERPGIPDIDDSKFDLRNPIDHFAARRLVSENLTQSPQADRYALARRVSLDLTGLPASWEEVSAFVSNQRSNAYEHFVEQQLSKPSYGEHWARMWLDLARYADSAGYADDPPREIWGFRDYVIHSFNENKPFDEFTIEQIAGDLLENASTDERVATAFHRNTMTNSEGGTDDEEFRNEAIVDRVNTTMSVWMGTTMACAQCHTHKYDPITQEEYFKVFAIFNSSLDEDRKDEAPLVSIFTEEQEAERGKVNAEVVALTKALEADLSSKSHRKRRSEWEERLKSGEGWRVMKPLTKDLKVNSEAPVVVQADGTIEISKNTAPRDNYTITTAAPDGVSLITGIKLEVFPSDRDNLAWVLNELEVRVKLPKATTENSVAVSDEKTENAEKKKADKALGLKNASVTFEEAAYSVGGAFDKDRNDRFSGWAVDGNLSETNEAVFEFTEAIELPEGAELEVKLYHNFPNRKFHKFRLSVSDEVKPMPAVSLKLATALVKRIRARSKSEKNAMLEFFARYDPESFDAHLEIEKAGMAYDAIKPFTTVPVMGEVPETRLRKSHIQIRGSFMDKDKEVTPGVPSTFQPLPKGTEPNRLGLAQWLVDSENPLTARVVANRYWEALFGVGIVLTSEDFGSQGDLPTHPDLLDWLAVELIESGWDVKHLLNLIVTSATYRQSSKVTQESFDRDPVNRLFARGPRFRISAEMIRDQALAVSGLLSDKMYGPSVNPPQPEFGLKAAFGGETDWTTSEGNDRYRRGIYTSWRRSNPYPSMATFDAPNREVCIIRRERTNTPLQALVTLNDPVYIETAQALGRRMLAFEGDITEKATYGFQLCLTRTPSSKEVAALSALFESVEARYASDPDGAIEMATNPLGPLPDEGDASVYAAWTVVANAMLNLDEMFLKR